MSDRESDYEDDVSDWEIEEGLPQYEDQFIQKYYSGREALIEQEKSTRSDNSFRQSLTPIAVEACSIMARILADERDAVWKDKLHCSSADVAFHRVQNNMERTKSWQIVKKMPKGALLHAHVDATFDVAFVIEQALVTRGMAMSACQPLTTVEARKQSKAQFRFKKAAQAPGNAIWTDKYEASQFVFLSEAADSFPDGGRNGFVRWLTSVCTITPEDTLSHREGVDGMWQKFASCFAPLNSLESYEPILRASIKRLLTDVNLDGVRWVDFRAVFFADFFLEGSETPSKDYRDFLQIWSEGLREFRESKEGKDFWGCRFIWTCLREWNKKQIIQHMKSCIDMKLEFPELICGLDIVGYENAGRSLADLTPELFWFKKRCVENGVDIPFFFHAGETLGDGDEPDQNMFDAILLGTRRIGHGFSLYKHPLLTEMVKTKKILVESCPISNEVLRLTSSIKAHPLPALLARGVPCCLSNDDPGILGYGASGVTHDFWQALHGWGNLGLEGLGSLAENSVRWACYSDQSTKEWNKDIADGKHGQGLRAERMRRWYEDWNSFCEWVVKEYGIEYGGDL